MSDIFDRIDEKYGIARMKRREPVLRAILKRYPTFEGIREIEVSQEEYDTLLDGQELPTGTCQTVLGRPVVVRKGSA